MAASRIPLPKVGSGPIDWELMLCTHVMGLRSLHWGLWEQGDALTLAGLRTAQARYAQKLLAAIPEGVRTVLDVGCGMGDIAIALAEKGYEVTCIAPVANYADHLSSMRAKGISFIQTTIENFESERTFDLVLMSESAGYFASVVAFEKSWRLLKTEGHLLVCNMFRREPIALRVAKHILVDFLGRAERSGFRLVHDDDITQATLPSLRLAMSLWEAHGVPAIALGSFYLQSASWRTRLLYRVTRLFFSREVADVRNTLQLYAEQLNPELVGRHATYRLLVFRKDARLRATAIPSID